MRRIWAYDELLEHARALAFDSRTLESCAHEGLNVLEARIVLVDVGEYVGVVAERVVAAIHAVAPFGMHVADAGHVELEARLELDLPRRPLGVDDVDGRSLRVPRALLVADGGVAGGHMRRRRVAELADHGCRVPRPAVRIGVLVIEHEAVFEIQRRPQPVELRHAWRRHGLAVALPYGAHAPGTVAGSEHAFALDRDAFSVQRDVAVIGAVLGKPGVVHHRARADAIGEARLLYRRRARVEGEIGLDAVRVLADRHTQRLERLDDCDCARAAARGHALHGQHARGAQVVLHPAHDQRERSIHHVEVRIDAQGGREEHLAVRRIAVEEVAVVEIAVGARGRDGLGQLVDGIGVGLGEHASEWPWPVGRATRKSAALRRGNTLVAVRPGSAYFPRAQEGP